MKRNLFCFFIIIILAVLSAIPISAATLPARPEALIPMGQTAGVRFTSSGLLVTGCTQDASPACRAGLAAGDFITHLNSQPITSAAEFQRHIRDGGGQPVTLKVLRRGVSAKVTLTPVRAAPENRYGIGVWVRDSVSGIGTLTFYDPDSGLFGALGHGINGAGTKLLLPIASGCLISAEVVDVRRGAAGSPGELKGSFERDSAPGSLILNSASGLYGILEKPEQFVIGPPLPVAAKDEVHTGNAVMLSNVHGQAVDRFEVEIDRVYPENNGPNTRNFLLRVTDRDLIAQTGGIVQGMSGSPVIQDGKLIGAVTHVLVSDPKRGYGIFIDNMLSEIYGPAAFSPPVFAVLTAPLHATPRGIFCFD